MLEIKHLNAGDPIIIYNYKTMDLAHGGYVGKVVSLSRVNFEKDTAAVRLDNDNIIEITDNDYFDKLPISYKEKMSNDEVSETDIQTNDNNVPNHYQGKGDIDVIEFCRQQFTDEEFQGAMKFNFIRYGTRIGRKDKHISEVKKINTYSKRFIEVLEDE